MSAICLDTMAAVRIPNFDLNTRSLCVTYDLLKLILTNSFTASAMFTSSSMIFESRSFTLRYRKEILKYTIGEYARFLYFFGR